MKQKLIGLGVAVIALVGGAVWYATGPAQAGIVKVYKSPNCGCCSKWEEHLMESGFRVESEKVEDLAAIKAAHGVARELGSCHTALIDGYVVEGHVPVKAIQKLLSERPEIAGISVPGMPIGSPGMEQGDGMDPYDVVSFDKQGKTAVFLEFGKGGKEPHPR
ncbi:MAG: DUF411 domain-containing protein [Oligoflexia bacterium]|nr:DUF411 domain-containing protein [Oligoflexia bacterium]